MQLPAHLTPILKKLIQLLNLLSTIKHMESEKNLPVQAQEVQAAPAHPVAPAHPAHPVAPAHPTPLPVAPVHLTQQQLSSPLQLKHILYPIFKMMKKLHP